MNEQLIASPALGTVLFGGNGIVEEPAVLGALAVGAEPENRSTTIGDNYHIRPFTTIYAGSSIGKYFQTGQGATVREDNVIGDYVSVGTNAVLEFGNVIGDHVRIHTGCFMELSTIEDHVFVGPNTTLLDDPHPWGCPRYKDCLKGPVIRKYAKIGGNVTILPGVEVGSHALVGAGSVVIKNVPTGAVVAGNPARIINRVENLDCPTGYFERPYEWEPYQGDAHE